MIAILALAAALTTASTPPPAGFSTSDLAGAAARDNPDAMTERSVAREAEALRLAIAYDPAAAIGRRSAAEQDLLIRALGTGANDGDLRVKWFMAGAIPQAQIGARSFFYNPLARGWLALGWRRTDAGGWEIESARVDTSGPVRWTEETGRPWLAAFVDDYRAGARRPVRGPGVLAGREADRWITGLATFMHDPARRAAADRARRLIADGHSRALGGGAIDLLPSRVRATYHPLAAFERPGGAHGMIFGSPLYPRLLIAADFDAGTVLSRLTLVNLANAGDAR